MPGRAALKKTTKKNPIVPKMTEEQQKRFDEEVQWCVMQLQLGLTNKGVDKHQMKESQKVINQLQSKKLSFVKKRQLMRTTFGDVKKMMLQYPVTDEMRQKLGNSQTKGSSSSSSSSTKLSEQNKILHQDDVKDDAKGGVDAVESKSDMKKEVSKEGSTTGNSSTSDAKESNERKDKTDSNDALENQ